MQYWPEYPGSHAHTAPVTQVPWFPQLTFTHSSLGSVPHSKCEEQTPDGFPQPPHNVPYSVPYSSKPDRDRTKVPPKLRSVCSTRKYLYAFVLSTVHV